MDTKPLALTATNSHAFSIFYPHPHFEIGMGVIPNAGVTVRGPACVGDAAGALVMAPSGSRLSGIEGSDFGIGLAVVVGDGAAANTVVVGTIWMLVTAERGGAGTDLVTTTTVVGRGAVVIGRAAAEGVEGAAVGEGGAGRTVVAEAAGGARDAELGSRDEGFGDAPTGDTEAGPGATAGGASCVGAGANGEAGGPDMGTGIGAEVGCETMVGLGRTVQDVVGVALATGAAEPRAAHRLAKAPKKPVMVSGGQAGILPTHAATRFVVMTLCWQRQASWPPQPSWRTYLPMHASRHAGSVAVVTVRRVRPGCGGAI